MKRADLTKKSDRTVLPSANTDNTLNENPRHGDSCGCGQEHPEHDDTCGSGQEHHHLHDEDSGCGLEHHHLHDEDGGSGLEHHHLHDKDCGCGLEHHHLYDKDCGCGLEHHHLHDENGGSGLEHHHLHDEDGGCAQDHQHYEDRSCVQEHPGQEEDCGCGHEHHQHDGACGCGHVHHQHDGACGCGQDHHHESGSGEAFSSDNAYHVPGHPAGCQCELCNPHVEYCDVCGESLANCTCSMPDYGVEKRVYLLENLGCANCAAKMEAKIKELPAVKYATITYTTRQLRVAADHQEELLPVFERICQSIESEVKVVPRTKSPGLVRTAVFLVENLDCANCAAKMEAKIKNLPGVTNATLTFATKQLKVSGRSPESMLAEIQKICTSIESQVTVTPRVKAAKASQDSTDKGMSENKKAGIEIGTGAVLLAAGFAAKQFFSPGASTLLFLAAYVVLGWKIVWTALKNLAKGRVFDENFLMSLATLAAIAIQDYPEAVGVMLFYRIGELFEHVAVEKSRSQIMDAVDMRPETVNLVVGEAIREIPAEDAQVGDILLVRPGDRIPLDGVVVDGESRIDTSPVTGEPVPVSVGFGSEVISGCVNTSGLFKIRVEKILEESMVSRILDSVENAAASKPKIDRFITKFARVYTPFVVLLALGTAIIPSLITGNWNHWIYTAITFLVISCPCALVLSVPLAFFSGIGAGSKKGILFKGGVSLEALKEIKAVVMDKTGTITKGNFVVQDIIPSGSMAPQEILSLAAACELSSTHPIGSSIVTAAREKGLEPERPENVKELSGQGICADTSRGQMLCGNRKLMEAYRVTMPVFDPTYGTEVLLALNGEFLGRIVISDTIKEDAALAISTMKKQGITPAMLTGDAVQSAQAVAQATGIADVRARLMPQDKLQELQSIRDTYGSVMFVGDGINDAPVLAGADVGAAMGSGADAAIEAADVVFMTSSLEAIPQSIAIAKATGRIAVENVTFALIIKALVMVLGLAGFANMWMAVFADTGVAMICVLNSIRVLYKKRY